MTAGQGAGQWGAGGGGQAQGFGGQAQWGQQQQFGGAQVKMCQGAACSRVMFCSLDDPRASLVTFSYVHASGDLSFLHHPVIGHLRVICLKINKRFCCPFMLPGKSR